MKPHTLYLEEMYTKNAEFPDEGRFKLKDDVLYTLCGDSETCESASSVTELSSSQPGPSNPPFSGGRLLNLGHL